MIKRQPIIVMALALCPLGAAAQSVTVVMENGLSHKFGADYVQSMTFEQVSQGSDLKVNSRGRMFTAAAMLL